MSTHNLCLDKSTNHIIVIVISKEKFSILTVVKIAVYFKDVLTKCDEQLLWVYVFIGLTAASVVLCGSPKKQPHTSSIVQFIFFFWSFEISGNILRNQTFLYVYTHVF